MRGNARKTLVRKSFVPEELRIIHRPEAIETRQWPGHWEGDLIKGAFNRSCVRTQDAVRGAVPHGRLHGPGCAGRIHAPDEETPGFSA